MVVVIQVTGGCFIVGETLHRRTVRKVNVRPSVIVVIENKGAVAGGFDDEFFVLIPTVNVECRQSHLSGDVLEMNLTWLDSGRLRLGGLGSLRDQRGRQQEKRRKKSENARRPVGLSKLDHLDYLKAN